MHIHRIISLVSLLIVVCLTGVLRAEDSTTAPEIQAGDVLLCEPYPHRTVTNTSRTVYQIARLGFASVRSFQQAHDLKTDGIIGPLTQRRVEVEYQRRFRQPSAGSTSRTTVAVSVQPVATATGITATIAIRSEAAEPMRIVGSLTYDEARRFRFTDPTASLHTKTCLRRGDLVACGGRGASVVLTQRETAMTGSTELPALAAGESGRLYARITYLSADLMERVVDTDAPLPKESQK